MKLTWDGHTNIKGVIEIDGNNITFKCAAIVKGYKDLLEVGNKFDIGGHELTLKKAKYSNENHNVYYEFDNIKEGF